MKYQGSVMGSIFILFLTILLGATLGIIVIEKWGIESPLVH